VLLLLARSIFCRALRLLVQVVRCALLWVLVPWVLAVPYSLLPVPLPALRLLAALCRSLVALVRLPVVMSSSPLARARLLVAHSSSSAVAALRAERSALPLPTLVRLAAVVLSTFAVETPLLLRVVLASALARPRLAVRVASPLLLAALPAARVAMRPWSAAPRLVKVARSLWLAARALTAAASL
jgi:hypothetical protein